ncbi:hypothetical protein E4U57_003687 [Claviceps arundinis]|uniref:AB hydrolase-1 domain-containing protein n=1 Tax=Claviceps arundinis TaxID=1623583 RepID=A0ABQ7P692_9HYPO|nr:hypothetical protein E4U57_003687 [Claviceps arundinis]
MYFPLGYKDAAYQWWNSARPPMAERNVLALAPYLKEVVDDLATTATAITAPEVDPFGTRTWRRSLVQLSGKDRALNEICVERQGEEVEETLVMLHGYGAGLGFFYKNFEPITRISGLRLYALDMLGMGNSSRPVFKIHARDHDKQVEEAEDWFIDALEEWRKTRKIERFTLLGHSLGGYLAVSYALKYPGHLKKLILASPVGIPENPYAVNASLPEPEVSTVANEFTQDQQATTATSGHDTSVTNGSQKANDVVGKQEKQEQLPPQKRSIPSWAIWLWDAKMINFSPFSIIRFTGPFGPRFISAWTSRRFNHLPPDEAQALHEYSFSIFKQKGSGEYALAYLLAPGAWARHPIINRIHQVGRQPILQEPSASSPSSSPEGSPLKETGIPIVFMYGENDWMDVAGGLAAEQKLNEARTQALLHGTDEEKRNERGAARVVVIPKAGHHLYLDNAEEFNDAICKEMEETKAEGKRERNSG